MWKKFFRNPLYFDGVIEEPIDLSVPFDNLEQEQMIESSDKFKFFDTPFELITPLSRMRNLCMVSLKNDWINFAIFKKHHFKKNKLLSYGRKIIYEQNIDNLLDNDIGIFSENAKNITIESIHHRSMDLTGNILICFQDREKKKIFSPIYKSLPYIYDPAYKLPKLKDFEFVFIEVSECSPDSSPTGQVIKKVSFEDFEIFWLLFEEQIDKEYNIEIEDIIKIEKISLQLTPPITTSFTFVILDKDHPILDYCLTIEQEAYKNFIIGIHTSDIGFYISKYPILKKYALNQLKNKFLLEQSFILPKRVVQQVISISMRTHNRTISIFYKINEDGDIKLQRPPETSTTYVDTSLTFQQIQDLIKRKNLGNEFNVNFYQLQNLTSEMRKNRLKQRSTPILCTNKNLSSIEARYMIDELIVQGNIFFTEYFKAEKKNYPPTISRTVSENFLDFWKYIYTMEALTSYELKNYFHETNIHQEYHQLVEKSPVCILRSAWEKFLRNQLLPCIDIPEMIKSLNRVENMPLHKVARDKLKESSIFQVIYPGNAEKISSYFTTYIKPLNSIPDFVNNCELHSLLIKGSESKLDFEKERVCLLLKRLTLLEQQKKSIELGQIMENHNIICKAAIERILGASQKLKLNILNFEFVQKYNLYLNLELINVYKKHQLNYRGVLTIEMRERIYVLGDIEPDEYNDSEVKVFKQHNVVEVPFNLWQDLTNLNVYRTQSSYQSKIEELKKSVSISRNRGEISSEIKEDIIEEKNSIILNSDLNFVEYSIELKKGDVVIVQVGSSYFEDTSCILEPAIVYLQLTPKHGFCIQHSDCPDSCFPHGLGNVEKPIDSKEKYVQNQKALILAEANTQTFNNPSSFTLRNVYIEWDKNSASTISGKMRIPYEFYDLRQLNIFKGDYFCIRYRRIGSFFQCYMDMKLNELVDSTDDTEESLLWIGHATCSNILKAQETEEDKFKDSVYEITISLTSNYSSMPSFFFKREFWSNNLATIQVTYQSSIENVQIRLLDNMFDANDMVLRLISRELSTNNCQDCRLYDLDMDQIILNDCQLKALKCCLTNDISVVKGPPGTGKSFLCSLLIHQLFRKKKRNGTTSKTLYCGQNNQSVKVIIGKVKPFLFSV